MNNQKPSLEVLRVEFRFESPESLDMMSSILQTIERLSILSFIRFSAPMNEQLPVLIKIQNTSKDL
jgi:hypothetical protein